MTQPDPQALDAMFNRLLRTEDDVLAETRQSADEAGMPRIEVSPQHAKLLSLLAELRQATRVLQIGPPAAYSTTAGPRGSGPVVRGVTPGPATPPAEWVRANPAGAGV